MALVESKTRLRLEAIEKNIQAAQDAANEETKSSAGDKYETGRAMAQNDRDLYSRQKIEVLQELEILKQINTEKTYSKCLTGALVNCSLGTVFIANSVGFVECQGQKVMVTSINSPIGQALYGLSAGQTAAFREKNIEILKVE